MIDIERLKPLAYMGQVVVDGDRVIIKTGSGHPLCATRIARLLCELRGAVEARSRCMAVRRSDWKAEFALALGLKREDVFSRKRWPDVNGRV